MRDGGGVEGALDARAAGGDGDEGGGVDDLVGGLPDGSEVLRDGIVGSQGGLGLPDLHGFVHAAAVEIGAGRAHVVVDEAVDFFVGRGPVEGAACVFDVAVERCDCQVDEAGHGKPPGGD